MAIRLRFFRKASRWARIVASKTKNSAGVFSADAGAHAQPLSLNTAKPPGTIRIFIFGSLAAQGRHEEAMPHYRAAVRAKPDFVEARFNLAMELARAGNFTEAIPQFAEVIRLQPDSVNARFN